MDEYSTSSHREEAGERLSIADAMNYLQTVEKTFVAAPGVYSKFLDIMTGFKQQELDTIGVIVQVSDLFVGYDDILRGFNLFLPPGFELDCETQSPDIVVLIKTPDGVAKRRYPGMVRDNDDGGISEGETDRSESDVEFSLDDVALPTSMDAHYVAEMTRAVRYLSKVKARFRNDPLTCVQFLEILDKYTEKSQLEDVSSQLRSEMQNLLVDAPNLLAELDEFMPTDTKTQEDAGAGSSSEVSPHLSDG